MQKLLLLGDEAIAQGFIDAGGSAINSYPGTPSTQITEYVMKSKEAKDKGNYVFSKLEEHEFEIIKKEFMNKILINYQ